MNGEEGRIGPQAGLYPSPSFGDGVWERVLVVLWKSGTKRDLDIARRLDRDLQETRRLNVERVARRAAPSPRDDERAGQ